MHRRPTGTERTRYNSGWKGIAKTALSRQRRGHTHTRGFYVYRFVADVDRQGFRVRPRGPVVPGVRRLLDPGADEEDHAEPGHPAREPGLHLGHRLFEPV